MTDKQSIEDDVNVYLNDMESITHDAGWEGDSILARVIEYGIANLSSGKPGAKMEHSIRLIRGRHKRYPIIATALKFIASEQRIAILVHCYYNGLREDGTVWNESKKAAEWQRILVHFGIEDKPVPNPLYNYRYHLKKSYKSIARELEVINTYAALLIA